MLQLERNDATDELPITGLQDIVSLDTSRHTGMFSRFFSHKIDLFDFLAAFGKLKYRYTGKHSEGNRFIRNSQL